MITAAAMPLAMKTATATSERSEKRPNPQTPWPLVQPPLTRVPRPTSNPAAAAQPSPKPSRAGAGPAYKCHAKPAAISPVMNSRRQDLSPGG